MTDSKVHCYFRFIIPTYNRPSVEIAKKSILDQTFKDVHVVVVHDGSDEGFFSLDHRVEEHLDDRCTDLYLNYRRWNGGTRNAGIQYSNIDSTYTMFLDDDDTLVSNDVLEHLYDFILENNEPDLIRLPYQKLYVSEDKLIWKSLKDNVDIKSICKSGKTAPWTKCIKSNLIVPFPENTTHEDVAQHIRQCDVCLSTAYFDEPVVRWHMYDGQTSKSNSPKWESSKYRFIADLMDLKLNNSWACRVRDAKVKSAIEALWKESQINQ